MKNDSKDTSLNSIHSNDDNNKRIIDDNDDNDNGDITFDLDLNEKEVFSIPMTRITLVLVITL